MTVLATILLLAGSFGLAGPGHFPANTMLHDAAVNHDMAKVKRQFERALHGGADLPHQASTSGLPPITR